jgi:hypothetical protein
MIFRHRYLSYSKMKKVITFLVLVFYLNSTIGATFHFHYCMGKLITISLKDLGKEKCQKCGMDDTNNQDCCKNVKVISEGNDLHACNAPIIYNSFFFESIPERFNRTLLVNSSVRSQYTLQAEIPSGVFSQFYLEYRSLRI